MLSTSARNSSSISAQDARLTSLESDTGWVDLALGTLNLSGSARYRVRSGMVAHRGRVTFSGSWPTSYITVGTLPATARPSELIYLNFANNAGQAFSAAMWDTGALQVKAVTSTNSGQIELPSIPPWLVG